MRRIGELLVNAGLVTAAQLNEALALQKKKGGKTAETLISMGYLAPEAFLDFLAKQPGVASIDLSHCEIGRELIDLVPREVANQYEVIPIDRMGNLLTIGMVCPLDAKGIQQLQELTGLRVKPLLCSAGAVRDAIERYYGPKELPEAQLYTPERLSGLAAPMILTSVARLIREINSLPALPETVSRVREAMNNPEIGVRQVADIIVLDPPIAAKVLGVANSAAYGFPQRVDDLTLAVSLLGLRETYSIVLSCAVVDLFKASKTFDYRVFWVESMCCAAASRIVAKASGRRDLFGVFSGGLLHDLGRAALAEATPQLYSKVDGYLPGEELIAAEEEAIGIAHTEAGYVLATHWELPPEIAEPIRFHHHPELAQEAKDNVAIVSLAAAMTRAHGKDIDQNETLFEGRQETLDSLGLDMEIAEAMLQEFLDLRDESFRDVLS